MLSVERYSRLDSSDLTVLSLLLWNYRWEFETNSSSSCRTSSVRQIPATSPYTITAIINTDKPRVRQTKWGFTIIILHNYASWYTKIVTISIVLDTLRSRGMPPLAPWSARSCRLL